MANGGGQPILHPRGWRADPGVKWGPETGQDMLWETLFWIGVVLVAAAPGYAAWVSLQALLRPVEIPAEYAADEDLPDVTCVLAAYNEARTIRRKLDAVIGQDYPAEKLKVLVVSDGSDDGTDRIVAERAAGDPRIRLFRLPRRCGKPSALNLARRHVKSEVMVLMDLRQAVSRRAVRELVAH